MTKTELQSGSKQSRTNGGTHGRRFRRIGEGLFGYLPTNKIYGTTRRADGHRVWRNLGTDDKKEARIQPIRGVVGGLSAFLTAETSPFVVGVQRCPATKATPAHLWPPFFGSNAQDGFVSSLLHADSDALLRVP